ncbi:hypothetical protein JP74_21205 [Devosia sp. 17-2-E-8]|nr:hypothetical protein JP74_21205 [Devosia sp. 17-2-E-8]
MGPEWENLKRDHSPELVDGVRLQIERADTELIDPEIFTKGLDASIDATKLLLEEVARLGLLLSSEEKHCGQCGALASEEDQAIGRCPRCNARYEELDEPFKIKQVFKLPQGRRSRDISWLVTVHGMNTDGPWQQDFSWAIAKKLRYSAPILIFKYPILRAMTLFERTQRLASTDLGERLRLAAAQASQRIGELSPAPDVVLHSYGTLLFSRLLLNDRFADLRFNRVILAGSIVRPDFDWSSYVKSGRIKQVINHCGDKDNAVFVAEFMMPNSGPSGRVGFLDPVVSNVKAPGYGHGSFFDIDRMRANLAPNGAWDRFLTAPAERVAGDEIMVRPHHWAAKPLALPSRIVLKILSVVLGPLSWFCFQVWMAIKAIVWAKS